MAFNTPVLFLIFNRPETTKRVFDIISKQKPKYLFIAGDGPRTGNVEDIKKCKLAREIISTIDWDCELKTLFQKTNLGCKVAVSNAIDWFFQNVDRGIILEDDTLPNFSFFNFCEEMLEYYKETANVMHIGGVNFQFGQQRGIYSYYFSNYFHIWGWATWRRAWLKYDVNMNYYPQFKEKHYIKGIIKDEDEQKYWLKIFDSVSEGKIDTWDFQWLFAIWNSSGHSIVPNVNLVSNIGFGPEATHTKTFDTTSNLKSIELSNINHPPIIEINSEADIFTYKNAINKPKKEEKIIQKIFKKFFINK